MESPVLEARREILTEVEDGLVRAVLPALGLSGRSIRLSVPAFGRSSLVFLVEVEDAAGFAVRVGREARDRNQMRRREGTERFWRSRGLPTPRVLHTDLSRQTHADTGFYFLCEQRIDGINAVTLEPGAAGFGAVGRAFARIHGVERRFHHGSFHQPRVGPFFHRLAKRHGEWTRALAGEDGVMADLTKEHRRWLRRFPVRGGPFQLLHRRCTESDVMIDADGQGVVLEPQRCGFGSFLTDLVRVEERICCADAESIAVFHDGYFAAAGAEQRHYYDAVAPVFRADLHLSNALRWARKRRKGHPDAEREFKIEFDRYRKITGT